MKSRDERISQLLADSSSLSVQAQQPHDMSLVCRTYVCVVFMNVQTGGWTCEHEQRYTVFIKRLLRRFKQQLTSNESNVSSSTRLVVSPQTAGHDLSVTPESDQRIRFLRLQIPSSANTTMSATDKSGSFAVSPISEPSLMHGTPVQQRIQPRRLSEQSAHSSSLKLLRRTSAPITSFEETHSDSRYQPQLLRLLQLPPTPAFFRPVDPMPTVQPFKMLRLPVVGQALHTVDVTGSAANIETEASVPVENEELKVVHKTESDSAEELQDIITESPAAIGSPACLENVSSSPQPINVPNPNPPEVPSLPTLTSSPNLSSTSSRSMSPASPFSFRKRTPWRDAVDRSMKSSQSPQTPNALEATSPSNLSRSSFPVPTETVKSPLFSDNTEHVTPITDAISPLVTSEQSEQQNTDITSPHDVSISTESSLHHNSIEEDMQDVQHTNTTSSSSVPSHVDASSFPAKQSQVRTFAPPGTISLYLDLHMHNQQHQYASVVDLTPENFPIAEMTASLPLVHADTGIRHEGPAAAFVYDNM